MTDNTTQARGDRTKEPFHLRASVQLGPPTDTVDGEDMTTITSVADATIPVMWCIQENFKQDLLRRQVTDPMIVISVLSLANPGSSYPNYRETSRYVAPLTQGLVYVHFNFPGENVIKAAIVWSDGDESPGDIERIFTVSSNGRYKVDFIDTTGGVNYRFSRKVDNSTYHSAQRHAHVTELTVTVPDGLFAPPPPEWERLYMSKFFNERPGDECQRKRRFPMLLWFPFFLLLTSIWKIFVFALLNFFGVRNVTLRPLWHPLKMGMKDVSRNADPDRDGLFWFTTKADKWRPYPLVILNPITIVIGWIFLAFLANLTVGDPAKPDYGRHYVFSLKGYESLGLSVLIHLALIVVITFVLVVFTGVAALAGLIRQKPKASTSRSTGYSEAKKRLQERELARKQKLQKELDELAAELDTLVCDTQPTEIGLNALPPKKRTVYLRLMEHKSKTCKPYAGSRRF